jgi:hypothetical protein
MKTREPARKSAPELRKLNNVMNKRKEMGKSTCAKVMGFMFITENLRVMNRPRAPKKTPKKVSQNINLALSE